MKRLILLECFLLLLLIMLPAMVSAEANYVGSEKCMPCHKGTYELWKDTLHNKSQQSLTPDNDTVVVNWQGTYKLKAGHLPEFSFKLSESPPKIHRVVLVDAKDSSKEVTYPVARTYGGWGWKTEVPG